MRKKRILFCGEATFLNTGYATYIREILNYLNSTDKYEIAELSAYGEDGDPRAKDIPWKFYGVIPNRNAPEEIQKQYKSVATYQFGEFAFEKTCLDFKPDIVCDIRDFWMLDFVERSPFRPFFKWCIMPTVDAAPQARQWIATYQSADACLTYSDWAGEVLQSQSGGKIKYLGSAPPSAHPAYKPIEDKITLKSSLNVDPDTKIIGTVMRNQRRKLYPDLFAAFRKFIDGVDEKERHKYKLYCHTSYPDLGWNIPELLQEYNLSSYVLFTYVCNETKKPFASLFKGAVCQSPFSGKYGSTLSNVKNGLSYENLAKVINMFDLYVQYANCEGFGLPQVEAAACAVPVAGTDYSAMESVLRQLDGIPITPKALYKELETGCMRAVPNNDLAAKLFKEFFDKPVEKRRAMGRKCRENFLKHFQWDKSGKMWEDYFDSVEIPPEELTWKSKPRIRNPEPKPEDVSKVSQVDLSRWLIQNVLCEPEKLNSYMHARLTRDLTYQSSTSTTGGMYFNESSAAFDGKQSMQPFNFEMAYNHMAQLCNRRNSWERHRAEVFKIT